MAADKILLEIVAPNRLIMHEEVEEVVCPGIEGELGILPGHTPLLTTLTIGELRYKKNNVFCSLAISWGYAEITGHRVVILAELAEKAEEIDLVRAEAAKKKAEDILAKGPEEEDLKRQKRACKRRLTVCRLQEKGPQANSKNHPNQQDFLDALLKVWFNSTKK